MEDGIEFLGLADGKEIGIERIEQTIDDGSVEKMVAHREKKGFAEVASGRKKRDAILFLPVAVFDEGRAEAHRKQLFVMLHHPPPFLADPTVGPCDSSPGQRRSRRRNHRNATPPD